MYLAVYVVIATVYANSQGSANLQHKCSFQRPWSSLAAASLTCEALGSQKTVMIKTSSDSTVSKSPSSERTESDKNALAVVPYQETNVLPHLRTQREFNFVGRKLIIKQNWNDLGVAAVVWDAAVVLGEYLERKHSLVQDKAVLELGSGSGLAGMVAALLGGRVTVTERREALGFLQRTVEANLLGSQVAVAVKELDWTGDLSQWEPYEVVLGADIVYIEDTFPDLLKTLQCVSGPQTLVLLSCRMRYERDTKFFQVLRSVFDVKKVFYDQSRDVSIYSARTIAL